MTLALLKWRSALTSLVENFGSVALFYALNKMWNLQAAIAATMLWAGGEWWLLRRRGEHPSAFFKFSTSTVLVFGVFDLCATESFLYRYEASVTNLLTAGFFGASALGDRPLLADLAEQSGRLGRQLTPKLIRYFRLFTLVWVAYFVIKAIIYAALARADLQLEELLLTRFILGNGSIMAMIAFSTLSGRTLYMWCDRRGWLEPRARESRTSTDTRSVASAPKT